MDFGQIADNLPLIVGIIVLIFLQLFFFKRGRSPEKTRPDVVRNLLTEVRMNQALAEAYNTLEKPKNFEVTSWRLHNGKLSFLAQSVQTTLSDAYTLMEDYNQQIDSVRKNKLTSYMINVDVRKLKEPLAKSRQGLESWMTANTESTETPRKYPGALDDLFGGR